MSSLKNGDFSAGMVSDIHPTELSGRVFANIENADIRNKKAKAFPGTRAFFDDIPSGVDFKYAEKFKLSALYQQDIWLMHAVDQSNSRDKLFVKPYISTTTGLFVDAWQDLTEVEEGLTVDSVSTDVSCTISGLASADEDYYKGWILVNTTLGSAAEIGSSSTGKVLTFITPSMTGQAGGNTCYIMRNPVFMHIGALNTYVLQVEEEILFLKNRDDSIQVYTGADQTYHRKTDFKLFAYKERSDIYGSSGYDEPPKFYLCSKQIDPFDLTNALSLNTSNISGTEVELHDPAPNTGYVLTATAVWDGYQESPIKLTPHATLGEDDSHNYWIVYLTGKVITVSMTIQTLYDNVFGNVSVSPYIDQYSSEGNTHIVMPRRITGFRLYMAEGLGAPWVKPRTAFRRVRDIRLLDGATNWSFGGYGSMVWTDRIDENDWLTAPEISFATELGHDAQITYANCDFAISSGNKTFLAGVANYFKFESDTDSDKIDRSAVYITPTNAAGDNTPDVVPFIGSSIAVSDYQMSSIIGAIATDESAVFFTDKGILSLNSLTLAVSKKLDDNTLAGRNAVAQANGLVYFAAKNDLMVYYPRFNTIKSLAAGRIREAWKSIDKDSVDVAVGYDNKLDMIVFTAGSTNFVFNVPVSPADSLTADTQAFGAWHKYTVTKLFKRYMTNDDGQLLGVTTDNIMHGLFDSASTESLEMKIKTSAIQGPVNLSEITLYHSGADKVTAKVYDLDISELNSIEDFDFHPDTNKSEQREFTGTESGTLQLEFVKESSTISANEIVYYEVEFTKNKRR